MDYKSLASNFAMAQTVLAATGLLAPRAQQQRISPNIGYYGAAIILTTATGIGFLMAGLYMYLVTIMPTYQVCLIMGAVTFGIGLAILGARAFAFYMLQRKIKNSAKNFYKDIKDILGDISEQIEKPITDNPKLGLIIALIAGFILSKKLLDD